MAEQPDIETMRIVAPDAGELERAAEAALRPKKLSEFVGQRVVRGQLQLVLDAARMRASTPDHVLLAGPPGLGKTTLASALAKSLDCTFRRIQFTPDLMPSDVTGYTLVNFKTGETEYREGSVMSQVVLADEISPDTCRFWDTRTGEKLDKDRFRRDLGNVEDAYIEIRKRLMGE